MKGTTGNCQIDDGFSRSLTMRMRGRRGKYIMRAAKVMIAKKNEDKDTRRLKRILKISSHKPKRERP